jgi:hypothetical protein
MEEGNTMGRNKGLKEAKVSIQIKTFAHFTLDSIVHAVLLSLN